jgi:uncharacterized protein (DUF58 family)
MDGIDRRVSSLFIIPLTLAFVGVLLFVALLHGQRDLAIVSLILFGIVAGAKLWTRWSLAGITCRVSIDKRRAFPGETLILQATAENRKFLPVWLQARALISGFAHGASSESAVASVTAEASLLWYQKTRFQWELTARTRGVHQVGPLAVVSGDLFGFFPKEKEIAETIEVIVYPRLVPLRSLALPKRDFFGIPGGESPVQDPIYILGTRDYQQGRPAKHIHWKATARHHRLQEKIFEPTEQEKILIVVDVGRFAQYGVEEEFERALEAVASVAVLLDERGCSVGLATNGAMKGGGSPMLPVARNPQQLAALLEALARLRMEPARDLIDMMRLHLRLPWGISCLYFSLEEGEVVRAAREFFTHRRIPVLFFVSQAVPGSGEVRSMRGGAVRGLDEIRVMEGRI